MTSSPDQVISLGAEELAGMLSAYTEVTERLKSSHDKLAAEVGRLRGELASKNRELERRSRLAALGQMAAGMAHEIRNPLGGIALYAGLLVRQLPDRPESRTLAERIANGVQRMDTIVNDILAFAGEIRPQKQELLLSAVLGQTRELVFGRLEKAGTNLTIEVAPALSLRADSTLLVRAMSNLLFNASDAAGEGEVRVLARQAGQEIVISVCDSGVGIAPEAMEKIFNPFFTTKDSGTGLGLAIVHRIVESHGGRISAANAAPPEGLGGAMFTLVLPRDQQS